MSEEISFRKRLKTTLRNFFSIGENSEATFKKTLGKVGLPWIYDKINTFLTKIIVPRNTPLPFYCQPTSEDVRRTISDNNNSIIEKYWTGVHIRCKKHFYKRPYRYVLTNYEQESIFVIIIIVVNNNNNNNNNSSRYLNLGGFVNLSVVRGRRGAAVTVAVVYRGIM